MRAMLAAALLISIGATFGPAQAQSRDVYVDGYTRRDGTYVQPYHRTAPDSSPYNNYGTRGNVNPYTGSPGTASPDSYSNPYGLGTGNSLYGTPRRRSGY